MSEDPIRRGQRWKAFNEEEGGIRDMIAEIQTTYTGRIIALEPWETAKIAKLAMAIKVTEQLGILVQEIIAGGTVEQAARNRRDRIEALPERKRKLLDYIGVPQ
jgi:hypothetical protein